jgi:hypothetical protein
MLYVFICSVFVVVVVCFVFSGPDVQGQKEVKREPSGGLHDEGAALASAAGGEVAEGEHGGSVFECFPDVFAGDSEVQGDGMNGHAVEVIQGANFVFHGVERLSAVLLPLHLAG